MLLDPDVIVMDEPTSSLDVLHEKELLRTLREQCGDKLLLLVSHRPSTLTGCDRVIRLEENYRSTRHILEASNAVIRNNQGRKGKELWTKAGEGEKLQVYTAMNENDEAQYVANQILDDFGKGRAWKDHAVLYRMNAQSNQLETASSAAASPTVSSAAPGSLTGPR